jgi:hypothetical protein
MKFSRGRTYNTHDTTVGKDEDGRIKIDQTRGVRARCELTLTAVLRFGQKGADAEMTVNHLNSRLKSNYTTGDIGYALKRLAGVGIIKATKGGRGEKTIYRASKSALDHWRKIRKG